MARRNVPGTTYLLHLDPPFKHARHYLGFAEGDALHARLADHGGPHGARLLAAAKAAGSDWRLVRTWPGTTRATERQIKNTRHVPHYCPECQPERSAARRETRRESKERQAMSALPAERPDPAAALGYKDAARIVAGLYAAGVSLDQISQHHQDVSARLLSDAQTTVGRAYAREFADTAATLVADLRADEVAARREQPAPGTPHPSPELAAKGWQQCESGCGVWVRREPQQIADREAG